VSPCCSAWVMIRTRGCRPVILSNAETKGVDVNRIEVGQALKELADSHWKSRNAPILLSSLPTAMRDKFPEAHELKKIFGGSVKSFIKKSGSEFGYQLIEHPNQRAKLGLAPAGVYYDFASESAPPESAQQILASDGVALLQILRKLSVEDQRGVSIPGSVIVAMFG
jgi:hypothetical protein